MSESSPINTSLWVGVVRTWLTCRLWANEKHLKVAVIESRNTFVTSVLLSLFKGELSSPCCPQLQLGSWTTYQVATPAVPGPILPDSAQLCAGDASCSYWPVPWLKQKASGPGDAAQLGKMRCSTVILPFWDIPAARPQDARRWDKSGSQWRCLEHLAAAQAQT